MTAAPNTRRFRVAAVALLGALWLAGVSPAAAESAAGDPARIARGEYLFQAAGCLGCHTDEKNHGARLAGGRALVTPFGTFYSPNITPDRTTGIGSWSDGDFFNALRHGRNPAGEPLYPSLPYPSYTGISDPDLADLWAYLKAQPPVAQPNRPHDLNPPFGWRFLLNGWQMLFFTEGPLARRPERATDWNRGRYLVEAVAHCGECHTPRGWFGDLDRGRAFAGNKALPDGGKAPNLTPDPKAGLGKWSVGDLDTVLETGLTPDGDVVGGSMAEVVRNTTSKLTAADRLAIITYLKSLTPLR